MVAPTYAKEIETAGTIITTVHDIKKSNKITINFNMWAIPFLMYYGVGVGGTKFNKNLALSVRETTQREFINLFVVKEIGENITTTSSNF